MLLVAGRPVDVALLLAAAGDVPAGLVALAALLGGVGVLLILYVKYVHRELLLGAVVAVLLTAEVSAYFDYELLLVLIAAGFVVRNFSE